jgi:hypothetical protein
LPLRRARAGIMWLERRGGSGGLRRWVGSGARRLRTVASCELAELDWGAEHKEAGERDIGGGGQPARYRRSQRLIAEPGRLAGCRSRSPPWRGGGAGRARLGSRRRGDRLPAGPLPLLLKLWEQEAHERMRDAFDEAFGGMPGGVAVRRLVVRAAPGPALVELADQPGDLLVVGYGGRSRLGCAVHGHVTRYCLAHARCPVLAVPPPELIRALRPRRHHWRPEDFATPWPDDRMCGGTRRARPRWPPLPRRQLRRDLDIVPKRQVKQDGSRRQ